MINTALIEMAQCISEVSNLRKWHPRPHPTLPNATSSLNSLLALVSHSINLRHERASCFSSFEVAIRDLQTETQSRRFKQAARMAITPNMLQLRKKYGDLR